MHKNAMVQDVLEVLFARGHAALARGHPSFAADELRELGEAPAFQELEERHKVGLCKNSLERLGWKPWEQRVAFRHCVPMPCDGHGPLRIGLVTKARFIPKGRKPLDSEDSRPQLVAMPPVGGQPLPVE